MLSTPWPATGQEAFADVGASLERVVIGLSLGAASAVAAAILTSSDRRLDLVLGSILRFFRSIPALALVPFVMLAFGISESSRYVLIAWAAFFPVWINAHTGLSTVDPRILRLGSEVYHSAREMYFYVRIPFAIPFIATGIRVSIGTSFILLVAAELMGATSGVAYRLGVYQQIFRLDLVCMQLALLGLFGLLADRIYLALVRRCLPWIRI